MPSPFPGMNPYLEQTGLWRNFHTNYLVGIQAVLNPVVQPAYYVGLEENLYLEPVDDRRKMFAIADAAVSAPNKRRGKGRISAAGTMKAPVTTTIPEMAIFRKTRRWLTIRSKTSRKIVTVIEMFSPTDKKSGPDRDRYLAKRNRLLDSPVNLIEIDLLRGGLRMPVEEEPECDYLVLVSRRKQRPNVDLWPIGLRDPLPTIPIPLRAGDEEPKLDMQAVLHRAYDEGGFALRIHEGQPEPPLAAADARWVKGLISAK